MFALHGYHIAQAAVHVIVIKSQEFPATVKSLANRIIIAGTI